MNQKVSFVVFILQLFVCDKFLAFENQDKLWNKSVQRLGQFAIQMFYILSSYSIRNLAFAVNMQLMSLLVPKKFSSPLLSVQKNYAACGKPALKAAIDIIPEFYHPSCSRRISDFHCCTTTCLLHQRLLPQDIDQGGEWTVERDSSDHLHGRRHDGG